jgi:D-sedoheptulose 7-phosphate isomerase
MDILDIINTTLDESVSLHSLIRSDPVFIKSLGDASKNLIDTFEHKGKVLLAGNGGSAADCQHIAAEFVGRLNFDREPLPAIAMTANTSNLTCIANDYGYDEIFSRQIRALASPNDTLVAYTTSGKSPNILKLIKEARGKVKHIISLTGNYTDELAVNSDVIISVKSVKTTRIQEVHAIAGHILCEVVEEHFFGADKTRE